MVKLTDVRALFPKYQWEQIPTGFQAGDIVLELSETSLVQVNGCPISDTTTIACKDGMRWVWNLPPVAVPVPSVSDSPVERRLHRLIQQTETHNQIRAQIRSMTREQLVPIINDMMDAAILSNETKKPIDMSLDEFVRRGEALLAMIDKTGSRDNQSLEILLQIAEAHGFKGQVMRALDRKRINAMGVQ